MSETGCEKRETDKETSYAEGYWDMFELITSTYYGKQYYFRESNGLVYSRLSCTTMTFEEAVAEYLKEIWTI